jgi:hypothetical protein
VRSPRGPRRRRVGAPSTRDDADAMERGRRFAARWSRADARAARLRFTSAGFCRYSRVRAASVADRARHRVGRHRARIGITTRPPAHANARATTYADRYHRVTGPVHALPMARRSALLTPRVALAGLAKSTRDECHMPPSAPCYHRPSPVVCSVPVTGRTVTMPDGRVRGRSLLGCK